MKTILRIIIILVVAVGISGLALLAVNAGATGNTEQAGRVAGQGRPGESPSHLEGQAPEGFGAGQMHAQEQASRGRPEGGFLPGREADRHGPLASFETVKNLVVVTLVVLAVWLFERLLRRRRKGIAAVPVNLEEER